MISQFSRVAMSVTLGFVSAAGAQGLPNDFSPAPPAATGRPPSVGNGFAMPLETKSVGSYTPAQARAMAARAVSAIDTLQQTVERNQQRVKELDGDIARLDAEVERLSKEKASALADISAGHVCTGCARTVTEMRRDGVGDVFGHVRQNSAGGVLQPLPAAETAKRIADKTQEFDRAIADAKKRRDAATEERTTKLDENRAAYPQIQEGINLWQTATTFEQNLLAANEQAAQERDRSDLAKAKQKLIEVDDRTKRELSKAKPDPATLEALGQGASLWKDVASKVEREGDARFIRYQQDVRNAQEARQKEYERITSGNAKTSDFVRYSPFGLQQLPSLTVIAGPVSVQMSPGQAGVGFKFGRLGQGGLTVRESDTSSEVSAFFTAFKGTPAASTFGVSSKTTMTPDGIRHEYTNEPKPFVKTDNKLDLTVPKVLDGPKPKKPLPLIG